MATAPVEESSSKALKCQTWVLKVSIHCQGCKRQVKKVLLGIDGVYTATIDSQQQRVTVTGNIEVDTLIKRLVKKGKHAEIWTEKMPSKEKETGKQKNMQKQNDSKSSQESSNNEKKRAVKFSGMRKDVGKSPENLTVSEESPQVKNNVSESEGEGVSGVKSRGNRKKKKGQIRDNNNSHSTSPSASASASPSSGKAANTEFQTQGMGINQAMGSSNLNPTRHQSVPYPQGYNYNIPPAYASHYRMACPREYSYPNPGPFFYVPVSPCPRVTQLDSFFYFSDENAHGCSIM